MSVQARPQRLKQTKLWELALRFGFGGLCTMVAGLIAKRFGAAVGGLFLAFPAIFPSGASLIESHEEERKRRHGMHGKQRGRAVAGLDAAGAAMGCVGLAVFAAVVWLWLPGRSAVAVIGLATLAWLGTAVLVWRLRMGMAYHGTRRRLSGAPGCIQAGENGRLPTRRGFGKQERMNDE